MSHAFNMESLCILASLKISSAKYDKIALDLIFQILDNRCGN